MAATLDDEVAELRRANAELQRRLDEATVREAMTAEVLQESLEYQSATSDVLKVISRSTFDLQPVLDTLVETAARLCCADIAHIATREGNVYRPKARFAMSVELDAFVKDQTYTPDRGTITARTLLEKSIVHVADVATDPEYAQPEAQRLGAFRSVLGVPLMRDDMVIGAIVLGRLRVEPFTDRQIELVTTFADQAVIAIENVRLLTETHEALDQQTATAEVLQVINASPGNLSPVFDAMLDKATQLCEAEISVLWTYYGDRMEASAILGAPPRYAEFLRQGPRPLSPTHLRLQRGEPVIQIVDVPSYEGYLQGLPLARALFDLGGVRTILMVPLRKDEAVLGAFAVYRREIRPFTDKQIALLQNFAAQAVIAMENARLLTETREALEQQTATAEVLQVINSSPGDLRPVFDAMLEKATLLCGAGFGILWTYDGERFRAGALHNVPAAYAEFLSSPIELADSAALGDIERGHRYVHVPDLAASVPHTGSPLRRATVELGGARTGLAVPLQRDQTLLGIFVIYRQEVQPFSEKQIGLLQNFAAQAVIAMENARLITETREALNQQTATAEVLQVINTSPGDLAPVFDAMLDKAIRLCETSFGILWTYDSEQFSPVLVRGPAPFVEFYRDQRRLPPVPGSALARHVCGEDLIQIADIANDALYKDGNPRRRAYVELGGARTAISVPLRKEGTLLGAIQVYRQEVRSFSEKQIALLQNFAAQAVIAMENARLLDGIRQRQAELRTTFDNMADGVVMFDESLRLAAWNLNFQRILDLSDAVLAEHPSYTEYVRMLADRGEFGTDNVEEELSRRLEHTDREFRAERSRPDGKVIEVRRNAVPGGGFVLIYSDITERKRSEAEIRAARDAAEAAYRDLKAAQASLVQAEKMASLGQLTAGIAHEIKNPLNFVNNFAGLSVELLDELKETAAPAITALDDEKRTEIDETIEMLTGNLEKIAEHGRRADNIVKSMLEHSRGSSGDRRSVDLNSLIEEALNLAYHGGRAQDQSFNITLERDYVAELAPIELVPQDITRVCLNLFGNGFYAATKRQREGGDPNFKPTLKVSTRDLGDAVEVRIRDNGTGIPPEIKDKLFQPFFTTKPTGEGTGLGLSISYDIVTQQHGGAIGVDSQVGEYTEFTVRLPRRHRTAMADAAS